jgi:DNA-binding NarL/FixJ family response regulator
MARTRIRILCVDDHPTVLEGIALVIECEKDMEVVARAATSEEAVRAFKRQRPDLTLMDLRLGPTSGIEAIREIRAVDPAARIVVFTVARGEEDIYAALEAGAVTYLFKDSPSGDLVRVLRQVHAGQPPEPSVEVKTSLDNRATRTLLTRREHQVLQLVSEGLRNKEIAAVLGIGDETAIAHVRSILAKLEVKDRTAAVNVALRRGILHLA